MADVFTEQELLAFLYVGIFGGVLVLVSGLAVFFNPRENTKEAKSRRMRLIASGKSTEEILAVLKPQQNSRVVLLDKLERLLHYAAWRVTPAVFVTLCLSFSVAAGVAVFAMTGSLTFGALGVAGGFALPFVALTSTASKRRDKLVHQLPDALELLARGLRVGHPLNTSVQAVAEEMDDPIASEFGIVFDQVSYGEDLTEAFNEFAARVDVEDVHYLASSVGIQHGTGGDLARVIDVLARVVRGRIALRRKVQAISAEGRMTAWFLSALPLIMFLFTMAVSPGYYGDVIDHPWFMPMAGMIIVFTVLNAVVLRILVNFKV
ncbi:MAG: type II secretion system F family protein [Arenibacterium sp.]